MWPVPWQLHKSAGLAARVDLPWHGDTCMLGWQPCVCWAHIQLGFSLLWQVCLLLLLRALWLDQSKEISGKKTWCPPLRHLALLRDDG